MKTENVGRLLQSYPFVTDWWKQERSDVRIKTECSWWERVKYSVRWLNPRRSRYLKWDTKVPYLWRFGMVWFCYRKSRYETVDDVLDGNNYFTWGEAADYVVMVQPLVGEVIGQFLIDEPDHPHAIKIAEAVREALDNARDG